MESLMPFASSSPRENALPVVIHERKVREALGDCSHWKVWDLCRNDPDFPAPRMIAGKRSWFLAEIKAYIESRPRRQYADSTA